MQKGWIICSKVKIVFEKRDLGPILSTTDFFKKIQKLRTYKNHNIGPQPFYLRKYLKERRFEQCFNVTRQKNLIDAGIFTCNIQLGVIIRKINDFAYA